MAVISLFPDDTYLYNGAPTTNYNTSDYLIVGERNDSAGIHRSLIKTSFLGIPSGAVFSAVTLRLAPKLDRTSNARVMRVHRVLRSVTITGATWNTYNGSSNWGTAGCSASGSDYAATELGSVTVPAAPILDQYSVSVELSASEVQKMLDGTYTNNGMVLFMDTQSNDATYYYTQAGAAPPYFAITYTYPPTVTTQAVSNILATTATGNGNVTVIGDPTPTAHGVCWNTTGTPTISDSKVDLGAKASTGAFTCNMTGLSPSTTHYVRSFVTSSMGTYYGGQVSFTTATASSVPQIIWW